MFLGVKAVFAKTFARIHRANLINFGILPILFTDPAGYDRIAQGDRLELAGVREAVKQGAPVTVRNLTQGTTLDARTDLSTRERDVVLGGGLLNYTKSVGASARGASTPSWHSAQRVPFPANGSGYSIGPTPLCWEAAP